MSVTPCQPRVGKPVFLVEPDGAWPEIFVCGIQNIEHMFRQDPSMKPLQLGEGYTLVQNFFVGFVIISEVALVVDRSWGSNPEPP